MALTFMIQLKSLSNKIILVSQTKVVYQKIRNTDESQLNIHCFLGQFKENRTFKTVRRG